MVSENFKAANIYLCDRTPYNLVGEHQYFREHICCDIQSRTIFKCL